MHRIALPFAWPADGKPFGLKTELELSFVNRLGPVLVRIRIQKEIPIEPR